MCDAFLVLAQAPGGLTCYLLPRVLPDGTRNALGSSASRTSSATARYASAEIRLEGAWARRVGEEGRGRPTIVEMVTSRASTACSGSTRADAARRRRGDPPRAAPLGVRTPARRAAAHAERARDLCLDFGGRTVLALRLARALDEGDRALARLGIAVAKYQVCKATPTLVAEALECLGGNGYVEESVLPRLYRESPLNSIWEGSGNVQALDVLRALHREPESVEAFLAELEPVDRARVEDARRRCRRGRARGGSWRRWPALCRPRSSTATATRRSRRRSAPATGRVRSARCRPGSTRSGSSSGTARLSTPFDTKRTCTSGRSCRCGW
jgi:putative acyl-CoA dehydrogenase